MALTFTLAFDTTSVFWGGERCDRRWSEVEDGLDVLGTVGVPIRCQRWFSFRWSWNLPPVNVKYWQQPRGPGSPDVGPDLLGETGTLMIDEPQRLIHQVRRTGPDTAMSLPCGRRVLQPSYICQLTSVPRSTTPPLVLFLPPPLRSVLRTFQEIGTLLFKAQHVIYPLWPSFHSCHWWIKHNKRSSNHPERLTLSFFTVIY